jgi:hypothetical protein
MSIRNQPYLPLYVQDFLTDEKLAECSASATGVYIRLMCLMHKSDEYGKILLKQKDKVCLGKTEDFALADATDFAKTEWFANKISKHFPYDYATVKSALLELIGEGVLLISGDYLIQKRMVKDAQISELRSQSGKKGGEKTAEAFALAKPQAKGKAKPQANAEIENEYVIEYPFNSEEFKEKWKEWLDYKKESHKFSYKSKQTEQTAINTLAKLSDHNEAEAIEIINNSIMGGYEGLFKSKNKNNGQAAPAKVGRTIEFDAA